MTVYIVGYSAFANGDARVDASNPEVAKAVVEAWLTVNPPTIEFKVHPPVALDDLPDANVWPQS